ncbi:MAG: MerR family DNA-binding transcriptional regulator [Actinobacteria bacterium]|nr:MerR family DNA-binding transcriptional regulator [Actinomycetota bacterium]
MTISELAEEFGITPRAIRYYEELGLLCPHRKSPTSQRLYDEKDRVRLKLILRGKRFGFSLAETREILELYEADPTERRQIQRTLEYGLEHLLEIDEKIDELKELRREMLEFARRFLKILESMAEEDPRPDPRLRKFLESYRPRLEAVAKRKI